MEGLSIFITAVGSLIPVSHQQNLNPFRDGIYLKSGLKEALYLPGEARTLSYAIKQIRAKAGIGMKEKIQIFKFKTETVEVKLEK